MLINVAQIQADRQAIIAEMPVSVVIDGRTYSGRKTSGSKDMEYSDQGYKIICKMSIALLTLDVIENNSIAKVEGVDYRIFLVEPGSVLGCQTIHLEDINS